MATTKKGAKTTKKNESVKNEVKNVKLGQYVQCDFSVLNQPKDMATLKLWADDMAAQLKAAYTTAAEKLAKGVTKTESKKTEKTAESKTEKKATKKGRKTRSLAKEVEQVAITDKKAIKKLGLKFVRYTEKCCVLIGETKAIHDSLVENFKGLKFGNLQQGELKGQKGWLFSNARAEEFSKLTGMKVAS